MKTDAEVRDYLSHLIHHNSLSKSSELIGYSAKSYRSMVALLHDYGLDGEPMNVGESIQEKPETVIEEIKVANGHPIGVERCVVIGDTHHPQHDERAISVALSIIEDLQPQQVILNGDIADMYALSRFNKDPRASAELQNEINSVCSFLAKIRECVPRAKIVWVEGNHEFRLQSFLNSIAPQLAYLDALTMEKLFNVDAYDIEYVPSIGRTAFTTYGPIKIGHFNKVSKYSAYTAKLLLDTYMCSLVQGHTHRLGTHYRTVPGLGEYVAAESGCLCDLEAEYIKDPDWQHGLTIITKVNREDRFFMQQVPIVDYEALFNDKRYIG